MVKAPRSFGFAHRMSDKEIGKLVRQMGRVWGLQKKFVFILCLRKSVFEMFFAEKE